MNSKREATSCWVEPQKFWGAFYHRTLLAPRNRTEAERYQIHHKAAAATWENIASAYQTPQRADAKGPVCALAWKPGQGRNCRTGSLRCMTFHPNHREQGIRRHTHTHTLQIILTSISTQCLKALNKAYVQGHLCRHRHLLIYGTSPGIWNMEQLLMQTKFLLNKTQNKWSIWEQKEWKQRLLCSCPDARVETHELYSYHPLQTGESRTAFPLTSWHPS